MIIRTRKKCPELAPWCIVSMVRLRRVPKIIFFSCPPTGNISKIAFDISSKFSIIIFYHEVSLSSTFNMSSIRDILKLFHVLRVILQFLAPCSYGWLKYICYKGFAVDIISINTYKQCF